MNENNPLRQYFRRPAIYIQLPSQGKYYPPGVVNIPPNGELPVYPMSSIDEITIKTPDGLFNGDAVVRVVKSCIPDIQNPWMLNSVDLEAVIVAIRAASVDGKIDVTSTCPECSEETTFTVDLMGILNSKIEVDYDTPLNLRDLEIKFRPLTYLETNQNGAEQFKLQRTLAQMESTEDEDLKKQLLNESVDKMNNMMYDILASTIEYVKTPETTVTEKNFIHEFLVNCDARTSDTIKKHSIDLRQKNDTRPLQMKCPACQHEYNQSLVLNFTDFFA